MTDINPMDWYGLREMDWIPSHFTCVPLRSNLAKSKFWIKSNTHGRYAFGKRLSNRVIESVVGFEEPSEATLYTLSFSHENIYDTDF